VVRVREVVTMFGYSKTQQLGKPVKAKRSATVKVSKEDQWARARARLKVVYQSHNITSCEYVDKDGKRCGSKDELTFAHIDKRKELTPEEIASYFCTLLLCTKHHQMIENDREETDRLFSILR